MENTVNTLLHMYFLSTVIDTLGFSIIVLGLCDDTNSFQKEFLGARNTVTPYFKLSFGLENEAENDKSRLYLFTLLGKDKRLLP